MPYKNKETQKKYMREWGDDHREEGRWRLSLWRKENEEQNKKINYESYTRNKEFYYALRKLKRKLDKEEII